MTLTLVKSGGSGTGYIFDVKTYGAKGDGITDDTNAIQAAANAAYAYANSATKQAIVYFPEGIYVINNSSNKFIAWDGSNVGKVIFRGASATIKLGTHGRIFVCATWDDPDGNFGNVTVENFIFDNGNRKKDWGFNGIILNINRNPDQFLTVKNITVRHCEVRNAPRGSTADPFIVCVDINIRINTDDQRKKNCVIDSFVVEDCVFGKIGYGGSYGVRYQAILGSDSALGTDTPTELYRERSWLSNIEFNNTYLRRIWHDGGPASQTYYTNSNFMLGSFAHGNKLVCEDLYGNHTGDDGLEVNSFLDVDINRCHFSNAQAGDAILLSNGGGMPTPELQRITVRNCTFGPTDGTNGGSNVIVRYRPAAPHGVLHFQNNRFYDGRLLIRSAYDQLIIRDTEFTYTRPITNGGLVDADAIQIDQYSGKAQIAIENVTATYAHTWSNPNAVSNSYVNIAAIKIITLIDAVLSFRNIQLINEIEVLEGTLWGGGVQMRAVRLPPSIPAEQATFNGLADGTFAFDSGVNADVTIVGEALTPTTGVTLTNELRAVAIATSNSYYASASGPQTDVCPEMLMTPGTTLTGYKAGIVGKALDASNYFEGYVYDDGTNSFLCLDKVVDDIRTSMLGTATNGGAGTITDLVSPPSYVGAKGVQLASRIATGTSFWVRVKQQGTAVQANYHTSSMTTGTTATMSATGTFSSSADIAMFVETQAYSGFCWVPISDDAKIDTFSYNRMYVVTGAIENVSFASHSGFPINSGVAISNGFATTFSRFHTGPLRIINCGIERHLGLGSSSTTDIDTLNDVGSFFKRIGARFRGVGAFTTLSAPGSGTAYTNASGGTESVYWYGGTLTTPYVEISPDAGATWTQVRGSSSDGHVFLEPGDRVRWTYSSAPTFKRVPMS